MSRKACLFLLSGLMFTASPVQADWLDWFHDGFHRNQQWPRPFVQYDREATMAPFEIMVQNGWKQQTMLCNYHFEGATTRLTASGNTKLRWILERAPEQYRTIYVQETSNRRLTLARIDAVQQAAARQLPVGSMPSVVATNMHPDQVPADEVDAVLRGYSKSAPEPRLPASTTSSSGGSGEGK